MCYSMGGCERNRGIEEMEGRTCVATHSAAAEKPRRGEERRLE